VPASETKLRAEIKDLKAQVERLKAEKQYEVDFKNQAWFFIIEVNGVKAFEDYKKKHPVKKPRLVAY
jgi:hypothetical protein